MECYREVLTFDPEEATAKERLGALTAAMERQVCGVCVGGWGMEDRGCCEMGCSLSLMCPSLVPVTPLSPLLDWSLCTAVCVCVCWTAFLHVVMVTSHSSPSCPVHWMFPTCRCDGYSMYPVIYTIYTIHIDTWYPHSLSLYVYTVHGHTYQLFTIYHYGVLIYHYYVLIYHFDVSTTRLLITTIVVLSYILILCHCKFLDFTRFPYVYMSGCCLLSLCYMYNIHTLIAPFCTVFTIHDVHVYTCVVLHFCTMCACMCVCCVCVCVWRLLNGERRRRRRKRRGRSS